MTDPSSSPAPSRPQRRAVKRPFVPDVYDRVAELERALEHSRQRVRQAELRADLLEAANRIAWRVGVRQGPRRDEGDG